VKSTGAAFTGGLADNGIAISMDGQGAWRDNVFVERLWRSVKYEEVCLRAYDSVSDARNSIGRYLDFCNAGAGAAFLAVSASRTTDTAGRSFFRTGEPRGRKRLARRRRVAALGEFGRDRAQ
jgi:transposase InsO family protein